MTAPTPAQPEGPAAARLLELRASSPRGLSDLLATELVRLGATEVRARSTDVAFRGTLEIAYGACLWSRTANRVFLELLQCEAADAEQLYAAARELPWQEHIGPGATLACDFSGRHPAITHTRYGALKLKDAICDALRERTGERPDISVDRPSVRVHAHAHGTRVTISLDLSGESLHRRGYRTEAGEAPLKENLAAGILLRAGWEEMAASGAEFLDPMCGSGTIVIEAAMIAADLAPGLRRAYFGFLGWRGHDPAVWQRLRTEARERSQHAAPPRQAIRGQDQDANAVRIARVNADRAGIAPLVHFALGSVENAAPLATGNAGAAGTEAETPTGLLCTNPPYGMRVGIGEAALHAHRELGRVMRERFCGWEAAVLTGAPALGLELGIRAYRSHTLWNGALECRLLRLSIDPESFGEPGRRRTAPDPDLRDAPGARMFANRLGKNIARMRSWTGSAGVSCYRLYDADMPEYALAIDLYQAAESEESWLYVQEYAAPASIDPEAARRRRSEALAVLSEVTKVPGERIRLRLRRRTPRGEQYRKLENHADFQVVAENGLKFAVNFDDYLDTGLFLDHRLTRARLRSLAADKRFLNLFAYTGAATVYAAAGGALASTSVDLSNTYLDWALRNLLLNGFERRDHQLVRADCRVWLAAAASRAERFDLVFMDPPTFSNSKRMEGVLDVQRDHAVLIDDCMRILAPGGLLLFATNARRFKLDEAVGAGREIRDTSAATLPRDFGRNPRIHRSFEIRTVE